MSKGKSLSERLAELANPTPQFADPEDEYNEGNKLKQNNTYLFFLKCF
jgi:hypothetical protein